MSDFDLSSDYSYDEYFIDLINDIVELSSLSNFGNSTLATLLKDCDYFSIYDEDCIEINISSGWNAYERNFSLGNASFTCYQWYAPSFGEVQKDKIIVNFN